MEKLIYYHTELAGDHYLKINSPVVFGLPFWSCSRGSYVELYSHQRNRVHRLAQCTLLLVSYMFSLCTTLLSWTVVRSICDHGSTWILRPIQSALCALLLGSFLWPTMTLRLASFHLHSPQIEVRPLRARILSCLTWPQHSRLSL